MVDVDDVILQHKAPLSRFLEKYKIIIVWPDEELDWRLFNARSGRLLAASEAESMLVDCFHSIAHVQEPIEGAVRALESFSARYSVLLLTNFPQSLLDLRVQRLVELGLSYSVQSNVGGKGRAVEKIRAETRLPTVFIDDSERQVKNVRQHSPFTFSIRADLVGQRDGDSKLKSHANEIASSWSDIVRIVEEVRKDGCSYAEYEYFRPTELSSRLMNRTIGLRAGANTRTPVS